MILPFLLLDEPTNGLDPKGRRDFLALVADLGRNQGKHVLLCTHLLPDVERTCDHVIVMQAGQVVQQESILKLTETSASILNVLLTGDVERFASALRERGHTAVVHDAALVPGGLASDRRMQITMAPGTSDADELFAMAQTAGVILLELEPEQASLEEAFLSALEVRGVATSEETQ